MVSLLRRTFAGVVIGVFALFFAICAVHAQSLINPSFESPAVTANTDAVRPTTATWTFSGQAGIRNNSAPNGSVGKQAAFLSAAPVSGNNNFGSVRQTVTLKVGTYYVRYLAAVKTPTGRPQPFQFYVNGIAMGGVVNPRYLTDTTTGGFEAGWTQPFVVTTAGSYELRFDATNATNYGTTAAPLYATSYLDAVTLVSVPGAFANAGFESAGTWTLSSGATLTAATDAPEGTKVLSLAAAATASQTLTLPAGQYSVSLKLGKASVATGTLNLEIASNGAAAATVATIAATTAAEYRTYTTPAFTLPSGSHVVTLRGSGSSFSVDAIALNDAAPDALNRGFETPVLAAPSSATAAGPTVANPTNANWTFTGTGGVIQANAGTSNTSAPRTIASKQYLALSGTGAVSQSLALAGGTYIALGQVAQGGFNVLIDGIAVGKLAASTLDFREVMSAPFVVTAGTHSLGLSVDGTYTPNTPKLDEIRLLRVDVPPAVSITAPLNGAVFQTGATVNITATASDPDGIGALTISRTPTGGATTQLATSASSPLSTSWSNSSANGYTITASATDSTGATSSTAVSIRVNANPSAVVSVSPTGPVVTSATAVTATVTVSSATDSDGTVTKIEFLQDAVVATTCTKTIPPAVAPFTCGRSLPPRAAAYALTVRVTDNDGGVTTTSPITLRINTAPTVTLTAACVAPCTAPGTINLTATPSDTDGTIAKVEFYDGASLLATKTAAPWTFSHTTATARSHSYTAKAFDNDNASITSTAQAITVTAPPPSVSLTAACTAPCNAPAAVTLTAVPTNIVGTISKVEFYDGATLLNTDTTSPYSLAAASVAAATHSYTAKVYVTGTTAAVATSTAQAVRVNALPTVTLTASCTAPCTAPASVMLTASPTDADGTISKVEFYDGATRLVTNTTAPWTFSVTSAATGSHSYTAKAYDNSSAVTTSTAQAITVTAPLPSVTLTAACTAPCNAPGAVALTAVPTNIVGTVSKVEFYDGATLINTDTTSPYSFAVASVVAATHSYTAKVYVTGTTAAVATSTAQAVRVNALPTVTLTASCTTPCTTPASVMLTASPADADGTIAKVEFYDGTTLLNTKTAAPWTFSHTTATAGSHSYTAKAFDNDNASTTSTAQAITVTAPLPSVALTAACAAPCNAPGAVALKAVPANIVGTVSKVEFYDGTTLLNTDTTSPYSFAAAAVTAATHSYTAKVYVTGTTAAVATSTAQVVSVNALPTITLDAPLTGASYTEPATIALSATASDTDGTVSKVEFLNGTTLVATGTLTAGKYTASWTSVVAGSYSLTARATDNRNAVTTTPATSITVTSACTAPSVAWVAPTSGAVVHLAAYGDAGVNVPLIATANLSASCGVVGNVDFYSGTTLLGTGTLNNGQYVYTWVNAAPGTYNVKARAYKGGTTAFSESTPISLIINIPPYLTLNAPANGTAVAGPTDIALGASVYDPDGTIALVEFLSGASVVASGAPSGGYFYATWSNVPPGNYSVAVRATDNRGAVVTSPTSAVDVVTRQNLALEKRARQSSTSGTDTASRATDASSSTASVTALEDNPWWEVDLGQGYAISSLQITPQVNCCAGALDDFWVVLSAAPIAPAGGSQLSLQQTYADTSARSDTFAIPVIAATGNPITVTINDPRDCCTARLPRYVRIWSRKAGVQLGLADVKVIGTLDSAARSSRSVGALLNGVSNGQVIAGPTNLSLSVTPKRDNASGTVFPISGVTYFDADSQLAQVTAAPYTYSYSASVGDFRFRARVDWADGTWAWSDEAIVRVQAAVDDSIHIVSPPNGGRAFVGDAGLPNHFVLRGTWAPNAAAALEYTVDCVPISCFGTPTWTRITQFDGASFTALVNYPYFGGTSQLTVRATDANNTTQSTTTSFTKTAVALDVETPTITEATGVTLTGRVRGLDFEALPATTYVYLEQIYYRDGVIGEVPYAGCRTRDYWTHGQCFTRVEFVRQFYGAADDLPQPFTQGRFFNWSVPNHTFFRSGGEYPGSRVIDPSTLTWSGGPRGWFRVFAAAAVGARGYLPQQTPRGSNVLLRFGSTAPEIQAEYFNNVWQGSDLPLRTVFFDFDDSRLPVPSSTVWTVNGSTVASAATCAVFGGAVNDPLEHKFECKGKWVAPAVGTYDISTTVTDLQGLNATAMQGTVTVLPWSVGLTSPADNAPFSYGSPITITATAPSTGSAVATLVLLEDGVVVSSKTTQTGSVSFSQAPAAGSHTYQIRATSPSGGAVLSQLITVRVLNSPPPTVSITSPAIGADFYVPATVPITVDSSTVAVGGSISQVVLRSNGTEIARLTNAPWTYNWTGVAAGQYSLTAVAIDNQGVSTQSAAVAVTVYANAPAVPTITMTAPSGITGFSTNDQLNGWACLQLAASSSDSTIRSTKVLVDGVADINLQYDPDPPRPTSSSNVCLTGLGAGTYSLKARAETARGAVADSTAISVTVVATEVALTQPISRDYYATGFAPALSEGQPLTLAMQVVSGIANQSRADFYVSGNDLIYGRAPLVSSAGLPLIASWSPPSAGARRLVGCVVSSTGQRSCASGNAVTPVLAAGRAITVSLTGAINASAGAQLTYTANLTVGASVSAQKVGLFDADSGEQLAEKSAPIGASTDFTLSLPFSRRLIAVAYSSEGYQFVSDPLAVTVSNGAARIAIISPPNLSAVGAEGTVIKVAVTDPVALIAWVEVTETTTGSLIFRVSQPPWQNIYTWSGAERSTSFVATVRYANGAVLSSSPVTVSLTNTPTVTVNLLADYQNSVAPAAIPLTANGTVAGQLATKIEYFVNGSSVGSATSAPYFVPWLAATAGSFDVYAVGTNAAGQTAGSIVTPVTILATPIFVGFPVAIDAAGSELSAVFAVQAPASSVVTIGGAPATYDFFQNHATVSGVPLQPGPNLLDIKVTLADGRSYTQPWIYTRSNSTQYGLEISPTSGTGGLSTQVTFRDIESAGYASVRIKCASNSGQDATGQPDYTVAQLKASGGFNCIYPADARVYRVAVDFLSEPARDAQGVIIAPGVVLERQVRYVSVTDPNTFRAQSTYGSFLAYLALGDVGTAVAVGFAIEQRPSYQATFLSQSTNLRMIAEGLAKILGATVQDQILHLRLDLGNGDVGDVFLARDALGTWRIDQL